MQERIKKVRKCNNLTQAEFSERINVTQSVVAAYENGKRVPRNSVIAAICREFNIREEWLREGIEPMEPERTREEELAFLFAQALAEGNKRRMALISAGLSLSPRQVDALADLALTLAAQLQEEEKEPES